MIPVDTPFNITPLPAFTDNYIWLVHQAALAWVIDPGDATVVDRYCERHQLQLQGILLTHHHLDHTGGVRALQQRWDCMVYAPESDAAIYQQFDCQRVHAGDTIPLLPSRLTVEILALPGHTLDHIAFYLNRQHLFSGDVLFGAGCGRLFEGSPAQMFASLQQIKQLPADTLIYPTHEYTAHNLAFASQIEPENADIKARLQHTLHLRAQQRPSLPTTLALELATNPFLRCEQLAQQSDWQGSLLQPMLGEACSALQIFTECRRLRNQF